MMRRPALGNQSVQKPVARVGAIQGVCENRFLPFEYFLHILSIVPVVTAVVIVHVGLTQSLAYELAHRRDVNYWNTFRFAVVAIARLTSFADKPLYEFVCETFWTANIHSVHCWIESVQFAPPHGTASGMGALLAKLTLPFGVSRWFVQPAPMCFRTADCFGCRYEFPTPYE